MRYRIALIASAAFLLAAGQAPALQAVPVPSAPSLLTIHAGQTDGPLRLVGSDARRQLVVTASTHVAAADASAATRDLTRQVRYEVAPAGVAQVDEWGLATAVGDGSAIITARAPDGSAATLAVTVERFGQTLPVNFPSQVVPIFTKLGCNAGACHGKSGGQNGFRLSLLGFEPTEDYEHLVNESRGRRLFPAAPERSLLLLKSTGAMPHGGGKRLEVGGDDYRLLARWVGQGMPYGKPTDPTVQRISVFPPARVMQRGTSQQLLVTAHYTDGAVEDVTRQALFEPNEKEMARVDAGGFVKVTDQPGDVAVMIRYQGKVATFCATVPMGAPVPALPPPRNFIDELVFQKLRDVGMPPSPECSDAAFLRRVTLDVAGRLPTEEEQRQFRADPSPDRRDRLIDRLLDGTDYADFFANTWSALLRNKRVQPGFAAGTYAFHDWVRDGLLTNKPYDQFVRELMVASGDVEDNPPVAWYRQLKEPKDQLEDVAQLFLGTRLQCAQCHHHPFERWAQQDYYSFEAFFSRVTRKANNQTGEAIVYHKRGAALATNPKTKQSVRPAGLGGPILDVPPDRDPRQVLADWMVRKDNPFFARALANRYWKHFLGRGLVEPEDDLRDTNPPTNPQLLDALARHFADSGYDLKDLIRTICRSRVYQLDSVPNEFNRVDRQYYSRYYPKRLEAEVLLDSVDLLTGSGSKFDGLPAGTRAVQLPDNSYNATSYFLTVFGRPDASSACACERSGEPSLAQSLHLLNAKDIQDKIVSPAGRAARLAADAARPDAEKVAELYRLAFAREPGPSELAVAEAYLNRPPPEGERADKAKGKSQASAAARRKQAYEDLIWALVNTKEFSFNH